MKQHPFHAMYDFVQVSLVFKPSWSLKLLVNVHNTYQGGW